MLREKRGDVRILAGGQTLLPSMAMRVSEPASVIALSGIQELALLRETAGAVEVGAMVRQAALEDALKTRAITHPVLEAVLPWVAHRPDPPAWNSLWIYCPRRPQRGTASCPYCARGKCHRSVGRGKPRN